MKLEKVIYRMYLSGVSLGFRYSVRARDNKCQSMQCNVRVGGVVYGQSKHPKFVSIYPKPK